MSMTDQQHRPWISKTWLGKTRAGRPLPGALARWQAKCACGLRGEVRTDRDDAGEDVQLHVDAA